MPPTSLIALFACTSAPLDTGETCDDPAPLQGRLNPECPSVTVALDPDLDFRIELLRLQRTLGFSAEWHLEPLAFFGVPLADLGGEPGLQQLRCDPAVDLVEYCVVMEPAGFPARGP